MNFYDKFGVQKTFGIACVANLFGKETFTWSSWLLMSSAAHHEPLFLVGSQQAPA